MAVSCGQSYSLILGRDGLVRSVGYNSDGQMGVKINIEGKGKVIGDLEDIQRIFCGSHMGHGDA